MLMRTTMCVAGFLLATVFALPAGGSAAAKQLACWKFDSPNGRLALDSVTGIDDTLNGNFEYVPGVSGKCLKFDGYTTWVTREAANAPQLTDALTIEAWIAPQTYSWNWTAVVDQAGPPVSEKRKSVEQMQLKQGLYGTRYGDSKLKRPMGESALPRMDGDWTGGDKDWSARWRGYIEAPFTGEVTFHAEAQNGLKLKIGKQLVIDGWAEDKGRSGKISMVKGKKYPVVLSYYQDGGRSFLHLYWSWPGGQRVLVPAGAIWHTEGDERLAKQENLQAEHTQKKLEPRLFFGIDSVGHIAMKLMINGQWRECISEIKVPLLQWSHIAGTFDKDRGINIYINGEPVGSLAAKGRITPAKGDDLLLGKSHRKMSPSRTERGPSRKILSNMIFDGLIDEVKVYNRALSSEEISRSYASVKPNQKRPLHWRRMPTGPKGPGRFGAYYCKLRYCDEWDRLWRAGPYADILVRFNESPVKLMFWRGTNYGAVWVTENNRLMGDQSLEATGNATGWGCAEHMSDKQCRYSRVRIIENSDARVVVHWRYAVCDIKYQIAHPDLETGWGDWADEYYYIYPDAVSTRKQVLHSNILHHEWQETIVLHQPGTRPEDNIELDALTLGNMEGQSHTYSWKTRPRRGRMKPDNPAIQITNLKSEYRPFIIFRPDSRVKLFTGCIENWCHFPWWNHWPVSQLTNDGRRTSVPDRPAHSSLSQSIEDSPVIEHDREKGTFTAVTLTGMTNKGIEGLVPLARSWNNPPQLKLTSSGFESKGYDRYQRAYVLNCEDGDKPSPLKFELAAGEQSPVVNPAFIVNGWGRRDASLLIDGKKIKRGKIFRFGHRNTFKGADLIVWVKTKSTKPITISLMPVQRSSW